MLQPNQRPLPVLQGRCQLRVSRLALHQALLLHCGLSFLCLRPSSALHLHGCLQEGHRAQLRLLLEVGVRRWAEVVDREVVVGRHLLEALAEAGVVLSLAALKVVEAGHHCWAWVVEEGLRCSAWVEAVGSTSLALVVAVELRIWGAMVVGWELLQAAQVEMMLVVEEVALAAHCS